VRKKRKKNKVVLNIGGRWGMCLTIHSFLNKYLLGTTVGTGSAARKRIQSPSHLLGLIGINQETTIIDVKLR
jgi:hypothetical protein